jgi:hypothetical protein
MNCGGQELELLVGAAEFFVPQPSVEAPKLWGSF